MQGGTGGSPGRSRGPLGPVIATGSPGAHQERLSHGMPPHSAALSKPRLPQGWQDVLGCQPPNYCRAAKPLTTSSARAYLAWGSHRGSSGAACPRALVPKFLSLLLRALYLLPAEAPGSRCPPSLPQLARLFHLKEKEREGKRRRRGRRERKENRKGRESCARAGLRPSPQGCSL